MMFVNKILSRWLVNFTREIAHTFFFLCIVAIRSWPLYLASVNNLQQKDLSIVLIRSCLSIQLENWNDVTDVRHCENVFWTLVGTIAVTKAHTISNTILIYVLVGVGLGGGGGGGGGGVGSGGGGGGGVGGKVARTGESVNEAIRTFYLCFFNKHHPILTKCFRGVNKLHEST